MNENPQALVVIDMQVDYFQAPELERRRSELVRACKELMSRARDAGVPILEVQTVHAADRSTWALNMLADGMGMVIEGSRGAAAVEGLESYDAIRIVKTRDSAFHRTSLEAVLNRGLDSVSDKGPISRIALCGVSTESCIALTASDAYARDIRVVLVEDAIASADPDRHHHTLDLLADQYRQPVVAARRLVFSPS